MKDLLLCVHVVVKTLTLEITRCHILGDYVKELTHEHAAQLFFLIQPIRALFSCVVVATAVVLADYFYLHNESIQGSLSWN